MFYRYLRYFHSLLPFGLLAFGGISLATPLPTTAFFYGAAVPMGLLSTFDRVVVEADNMGNFRPSGSNGEKVFAYISVGEAEGWRSSSQRLPQELFSGTNPEWSSRIADLTQPKWKNYVLESRMAPLWEQGYRGFFLDTLDSYQRTAKNSQDQRAQRTALVDIIRAMHLRFPGVKLLLNRGFEVLPDVAALAVGLVAESLFQGWNASTHEYVAVSAADRQWLLARLNEAHERYGLPITVIDYVEPEQTTLARDTARQIADLGFSPWVATPGLDVIYTGAMK